jgi:hypothetical protein
MPLHSDTHGPKHHAGCREALVHQVYNCYHPPPSAGQFGELLSRLTAQLQYRARIASSIAQDVRSRGGGDTLPQGPESPDPPQGPEQAQLLGSSKRFAKLGSSAGRSATPTRLGAAPPDVPRGDSTGSTGTSEGSEVWAVQDRAVTQQRSRTPERRLKPERGVGGSRGRSFEPGGTGGTASPRAGDDNEDAGTADRPATPEGLGGFALDSLAIASPLRVLNDLAPSLRETLLVDLVSSQPLQVCTSNDIF